jgi:sulfate adenylyltransferase subunit 1
MDILRLITAGNVDDGKSTLIGRLLYDTKNIKQDILDTISKEDEINLAHITDGLRAERQQGITIDVAYKYFTTKDRKYILIDAPGHFQYTKNLVTGASGADVMIILIDATHGITEQTKRHASVASFLNIQQIVVAVNKMDAVGFSEQAFSSIKNDFEKIKSKLQLLNISFIPISALLGDHVSNPSTQMDWYTGKTLMEHLALCPSESKKSEEVRCTIQLIDDTTEGKSYLVSMLSGTLKTGSEFLHLAQKETVSISKIVLGYNEVHEIKKGDNARIYLQGETQLKRGDLLTNKDHSAKCSKAFDAHICWLNEDAPLILDKTYFLGVRCGLIPCVIKEVREKLNSSSLAYEYSNNPVSVHESAHVCIETEELIVIDSFELVPENGRGILIDMETNITLAAVTIV